MAKIKVILLIIYRLPPVLWNEMLFFNPPKHPRGGPPSLYLAGDWERERHRILISPGLFNITKIKCELTSVMWSCLPKFIPKIKLLYFIPNFCSVPIFAYSTIILLVNKVSQRRSGIAVCSMSEGASNSNCNMCPDLGVRSRVTLGFLSFCSLGHSRSANTC